MTLGNFQNLPLVHFPHLLNEGGASPPAGVGAAVERALKLTTEQLFSKWKLLHRELLSPFMQVGSLELDSPTPCSDSNSLVSVEPTAIYNLQGSLGKSLVPMEKQAVPPSGGYVVQCERPLG